MDKEKNILEVVIEAAKEGGKVLERYFETELRSREKEDASLVTEADEEAEERIVRVVKAYFPDHSILGEEKGEDLGSGEYKWIIDPLDGTKNFANAIPIFAVSIAVMKEKEIMYAVVFNPIIPSLFYAEKGKGAFWKNTKLSVSRQESRTAMLSLGRSREAEDIDLVDILFREIPKTFSNVRFLGSAALEMAYLARGGTEGYINLGTKLWDYAAGALLVQEAGGEITDLAGDSWHPDQQHFIASNKVIHSDIVALVERAKHHV